MKKWYSFLAPLGEKIKSLAQNKKLLIIIGGGAAGIILMILLLAVSIRAGQNRQEARRASQELNRAFAPLAIKPEDLFLPREPDFIPEIIMNRQPRDSWTEDDAAPFWSDPLDGNSAAWKSRIHSEIDNLMETVP